LLVTTLELNRKSTSVSAIPKLVQIPFHSLRSKLKALCERYGLIYTEQEESYTSKASAVDGDEIPVYNADNPKTYHFSGRRIKRGLYRTKDGHLVTATAGSLNYRNEKVRTMALPECLVIDCPKKDSPSKTR
jgi:hypothetical protein